MGRDKALLEVDGIALAARTAALLQTTCAQVTIVGDPARYARFGYPVIADEVAGRGPLAGMVTALHATAAPWNLILACDMPALSVPFLTRLQERAELSLADCVMPKDGAGIIHPLCAAYRRQCWANLEQALQAGVSAIKDAVTSLQIEFWPVEADNVQNVNTAADWETYLNTRQIRETHEGGV
jgi:molybdopterin-guanine dinucleotide biosynthesis protein A